ncbi:MAG: flagellar export chaperone FlgN [Chthoniobacterales bacterium]|nr:flagellar export chaperone FlgN [Chthoniobacterales bacterium]
MRQLPEIESLLQLLIAEHQKLLAHVDLQQAAMRAFDMRTMDQAAKLQEAARLRIASLETRRRGVILQIARLSKLNEKDLTLAKLAEMNPQRGVQLLRLRNELKTIAQQIAQKTNVAGKLASAVAGHLNTVMRILAGAVEQAGVYTKHGVPQVTGRIGIMEALG